MAKPTTPASKEKPSNPFNPRTLLLIAAIAIGIQLVIGLFRTPAQQPADGAIVASTVKTEYKPLQRIELQIANHTDAEIKAPLACPNQVRIERKDGDAWIVVQERIVPPETMGDDLCMVKIAAGATEKGSLTKDDATAFTELGHYRATILAGDGKDYSAEFAIVERNWFSALFLTALYQPLYNALIWLAVQPGFSFGLAIIVLTLLVRLVLFVPTYRSLDHQAELQAIQPELQALQKKYKDNKEKLGEETLKLYREKGVNPCGSCLPLLVQLPVLWAMYYVLSDGLDAANHALLYPILAGVDLTTIPTHFLGIDVLAPKNIILAVLVGVAQWFSLQLTTWMLPKDKRDAMKGTQAAVTNKTMGFLLPPFIAWISYTYPSGLGLYWGMSTLFGIGQQVALKRAREQKLLARATSGANVQDATFRDAP